MSIRRPAAAAVLIALTVTACGTQQGGQGQARASGPSPSFSPRPECAQAAEVPVAEPPSPLPGVDGGRAQENGDAPPNYADNHAYRMRAPLAADQRAQGEASAALIRRELERVREEGDFRDERIAAALRSLGCGEEHGVHVGFGFYSVHTGVVCVSGRVTAQELTSEVHGAYAEPQPGTGPCVENRGGH
ncbi:hypothetical protein [Streptomyces wuyuanensis]|uniref:hypothetical protein n=1 Tax=Streptomyces wuyuanensis TaxID=1196353 RepID=UPI00382E5787